MTKITKIEDKTYQGKVTGHIVTLADGTTGYLADKISDPVKVGDDVSCIVEVKKNKQGGDYNLLTLKLSQNTPPPQQETTTQRPAIHVGTGKSKEELKAEATIRIAEVVVKGFCEGKLESAQVSLNVSEFSRLLWSEIEEIYSK